MMVTVATVGYGDKVPITTPGRLVAMLMMVFGVAILGPSPAGSHLFS